MLILFIGFKLWNKIKKTCDMAAYYKKLLIFTHKQYKA